jgi:hypothetical protein
MQTLFAMVIRISRRFSAMPEFYALIPFGQSQTYLVAEDHSMTKVARWVYTPHLLSAATTTLLLDAGVGIIIDARDCLPLDLASLPVANVGGHWAGRRSN